MFELFSGAADVALPLRRILMPYDGRLNGGTALCRGQELILRRERLLTLPGGSFPSCRMRTSMRIAKRSFGVLARGHSTHDSFESVTRTSN